MIAKSKKARKLGACQRLQVGSKKSVKDRKARGVRHPKTSGAKAKMDSRLPLAGMTEKMNTETTNSANGLLSLPAFRLTFHGYALVPATSHFTPYGVLEHGLAYAILKGGSFFSTDP